MFGERRSCVEPSRQTHPNGRKKRVKRHFRQNLSLDIIPRNRIEHQGYRPMAVDDLVQVLLDRTRIRRIHGHHVSQATASADRRGYLVKRLTPTRGQHHFCAFTRKGTRHCPADCARGPINDCRPTC